MSSTVLDELGAEAAEVVQRLLKRAYEQGYRDGLANTQAASSSERGAHVAQGGSELESVTASTPRIRWDELESPEDDAPDEGEPDEGEPDADEGDEDEYAQDEQDEGGPTVRPIAPHATVGTLHRRIVKTFGLERFRIDVILCARGDRDRRQLKRGTRLNRYLVER